MFNRGESYVLPVMNLYPESIVGDVKKALNGEIKCTVQRINITKFRQVSIDKITMRKNQNSITGIELLTHHTATGEYLKAWKKGLGRFARPDFKSGENDDKYYIVKYKDRNNKKMMALIRFIYNEEIGDELQDMKNYGAITDELKNWIDVVIPEGDPETKKETDVIEAGTFYVVLKIVPSVPVFEIPDVIGFQSLIEKPSNRDANWIFESDVFDSEVRKQERDEQEDFQEEMPSESELF